MVILDNTKQINKLDSSQMLKSIELLPSQIKQAWEEVKQIKIPQHYKNIKKVVINGMGGSGLGAHVIESVYTDSLQIPFKITHSYSVPGMLDSDTLYILSSYSGNTEEVVLSYKEAKKKGAKILAITAGGKLGKLISTREVPGYLFNPSYNLSRQPRIGLGYSLIGLLGLLKKCNLIKVTDKEIKIIISSLEKLKIELSLSSLTFENLAKQTAEHLKGKIPVIVAAEFLSGNAHILSNQINENAKTFANYFIISELNHHLLEGLKYPKSNQKNLIFFFIESALYSERNQKRFKTTQDVLKKNKIDYINYNLQGQTKLEQSFRFLLFGSFLSFYSAILNNLDPANIPWVDYFKAQLK